MANLIFYTYTNSVRAYDNNIFKTKSDMVAKIHSSFTTLMDTFGGYSLGSGLRLMLFLTFIKSWTPPHPTPPSSCHTLGTNQSA